MTFEEIKQRNFAGRTFNLTQENVKRLQDDCEWLIKRLDEAETAILYISRHQSPTATKYVLKYKLNNKQPIRGSN